MTTPKPILFFALATALLINAQFARAKEPYASEIRAGSVLILNTKFAIPPNAVKAYLQGGIPTRSSDLDVFSPHCLLEVRQASPTPQIVRQDRFRVTKTIDDEEEFTYGRYNYLTEYRLESATQPDVMRVICQREGGPDRDTYLTLEEVRTALGGYFRIELKPKH